MRKILQNAAHILTIVVSLLLGFSAWSQYTGTGDFTQITDINELTDGYYMIVDETDVAIMTNDNAGDYMHTVGVNANSFSNPSEDLVWRIETNGSGRFIYNEQVQKYVSYTGAENKAYLVNAVTNSERWEFTSSAGIFKVKNIAVPERYLQYNSGFPRFACYKNTQKDIHLYKLTGQGIPQDLDTEVYEPTTQIPATTIEAASATQSGTSFPIFKLSIEDQGTADGLPTKIQSIRLLGGAGNTANWSNMIESIVLSDGSTNIPVTNTAIGSSTIDIEFAENELTVADGQEITLTISAFLKTTGIEDGAVIHMAVAADSAGFSAYTPGSQFASNFLFGSFEGNNITIDVDASLLQFTQQPSDVWKGDLMIPAVIVDFVDINGNLDTDYDGGIGEVQLSSTGTFDPSATVLVSAISGRAVFDNIIFSESATQINLTAMDTSGFIGGSFVSDTFDVLEVNYYEDFEDGDFSQNPSWFGDTGGFSVINDNPIPGGNVPAQGYYLASNANTGKISLATPSAEVSEWRFSLATPDFDPSATNYFGVVLMASAPFSGEMGTNDFEGYYLRIGVNGNSDKIELWRKTGLGATSIGIFPNSPILGTGALKNGLVMRVTRDASGTFELFYEAGFNSATPPTQSAGTLFDNTVTSSSYFGVYQNFNNPNATRRIYFDNLVITAASADYFYTGGAWHPQDPSGLATASDDLLVMEGTAVLSADTNINNLTINPGATLAVERVLYLNGDIVNNGDLVFLSSATANGELGPVPAGSTITGQATVQRYMSANRVYRLVSSAVTTTSSIRDNWQEGVNNPDTGTNLNPNPGFGTHITGSQTGANGFDATGSGNPSLFRLDATQQAFVAVANTDVNTLTAGDPYLLFVRGDRSIDLNSNASPPTETILRARGVLAVGEVVQGNLSTVAGEFSAIGNPYQSAVDVNAVFGASANINTNHYYIFDPTQGTNGIYVTVSLPSGNNSTNGSSAANQYLQPGQGAQVQTLNNGATSAVFREAHKAPGQFAQTSVGGAAIFTQQASITGQLYITDNYNGNGRIQDSFGVLFGPGFDNAITPMDAPKVFNFKENIALDNNGSLLGLEYRALPEDMEQLPLYTANYSETDYTFTLQLNMGSTRVMLQDRFTGSLTQLEEGDNVYAFSVDPAIPESVASDRFSFVFSVPLIGVGEETVHSMAIYPNPAKDHIYLSFATGLEGPVNASIHDLQGRRVFGPKTLEGNTTYRLELPQLNTGTYFLRVDSGQQTENKRIIIE